MKRLVLHRPPPPTEPRRIAFIGKLALLILVIGTISACSSGGSSLGDIPATSRPDASNPANRILACKAGDRQIEGPSQCLQDDAACYQMANGWCTGERGNVCPAGSEPMATGDACPAGARCFRISESLECFIRSR